MKTGARTTPARSEKSADAKCSNPDAESDPGGVKRTSYRAIGATTETLDLVRQVVMQAVIGALPVAGLAACHCPTRKGCQAAVGAEWSVRQFELLKQTSEVREGVVIAVADADVHADLLVAAAGNLRRLAVAAELTRRLDQDDSLAGHDQGAGGTTIAGLPGSLSASGLAER